MKINQYDTILLKDGRTGCVVEVFENKKFIVDIGNSPKNWETLWNVELTDIEKIIKKNNK